MIRHVVISNVFSYPKQKESSSQAYLRCYTRFRHPVVVGGGAVVVVVKQCKCKAPKQPYGIRAGHGGLNKACKWVD